MGRQRRGVVGCTNLPSPAHICEVHHLSRQQRAARDTRSTATTSSAAISGPSEPAGVAPRDNTGRHRSESKHQRDKFKLPLLSTSAATTSCHGQSCPKRKLSSREAQLAGCSEAEYSLGTAIDAHERDTKSFKNEHWYSSPIGIGSKKAVLLAALKSRDPGGSGFITCHDLVEALQAPNFGLRELQARSLLADFDAQPHAEDAKLHYRSFVRHLRLPEEPTDQPGQDPTLFRQQSYINRVRTHAAQLIEKVEAASRIGKVASSETLPALSTAARQSGGEIFPIRDDDAADTDRLAFENDKQRKQRRADAKSRILLAHINRIEAFSRHQQQAVEQHETMRLAAKALHRHAHFERAFEEENRRLRVAQCEGKGLVRSPTTQMLRNVSKDSMFYVQPV
ncbi:hypothetical protein BBJ28_00000401 [Nothophytophthora sp. Chile5]|nr:hypothetical protein BBJ28_00000401 [Nothophytophthora sp. Chile5]